MLRVKVFEKIVDLWMIYKAWVPSLEKIYEQACWVRFLKHSIWEMFIETWVYVYEFECWVLSKEFM